MHDHFLLNLFSETQPRRSRIIYCVLKNEMTVSAEYWALRYDLLCYTRVMPDLDRSEFEKKMHRLTTKGLLIEVEDGVYRLSENGVLARTQYQEEHYRLRHPEVFVYYQVANFAQVMQLANQVVSEWSYGNKVYYPMQLEQQLMAFVKRWFQQQNKETLVDEWTQVITDFLDTLPDEEADRFVATWSGHETVGLANHQLSLPESWDDWDGIMWQRDIYAALLKYLEDKSDTPLNELVQSTVALSGPLTKVQKSLAGIQSGVPTEIIAQKQHLKIGTVREHFLTAAIWLPMNAFPYERFLTDDIKTYLSQKLTGSMDKWRFTTVRQSGDPYEFLLFRLYQIWLTKQEAKV